MSQINTFFVPLSDAGERQCPEIDICNSRRNEVKRSVTWGCPLDIRSALRPI